MYFFLAGEVSFLVEGKTYLLSPGDLLLINPSQLHQPLVTPGGVYERIVLWIDRNFLAELGSRGTDLTACFDSRNTNLIHPPKLSRTVIQDLVGKSVPVLFTAQMVYRAGSSQKAAADT
jgi:hypothetical protein